MVTAIVGAALLLLIFVIILLSGADAPSDDTGNSSSSLSPSSAATQPAGAAQTATGSAAGAGATAAPLLPGTPYSESSVLTALQSRGLTATLVSDPFVCQNPSTTPKTYRVAAAGAEQRFVLLVYRDAAAMNGDWVIGTGRPPYRNGACATGAAVIYFNLNVLLVVPQTTDAGLQQQVVDAFLTLP